MWCCCSEWCVAQAAAGELKTVRNLVGVGARLDLRNDSGWTALMVAADAGHEVVVEYLTTTKASTGIVGKDGCSALDLAKRKGHAQIVERLQDEDPFETRRAKWLQAPAQKNAAYAL